MIDNFQKGCFGCTACGAICSKKAITFGSDDLGFFYPRIDYNKCVDCNLCEKVCPVYNCKSLLNTEIQSVYAVRHKCLEELVTSRSGAAFIALSDVILKRGGIVYGAMLDDKLTVKHIRTSSEKERNRLKGSKYVQSDMRGVFEQVQSDLQDGKFVLFSGTSCQIAGLKNFIPPKMRGNLVLVDIICHGAPSPRLWKDYLNYLEEKYIGKVNTFDFRDKSINGWSDHMESFVIGNTSKRSSKEYTKLFYTNAFFRDCCYDCSFANMSRVSDITLGDFWGWEKVDLKINEDNKGVSLVIVNTEKGETLFDACKQDIDYLKVDSDVYMQRNLKMPTPRPIVRDVYIDYYIKFGLKKLLRLIIAPSLYQKLYFKMNLMKMKWNKK